MRSLEVMLGRSQMQAFNLSFDGLFEESAIFVLIASQMGRRTEDSPVVVATDRASEQRSETHVAVEFDASIQQH